MVRTMLKKGLSITLALMVVFSSLMTQNVFADEIEDETIIEAVDSEAEQSDVEEAVTDDNVTIDEETPDAEEPSDPVDEAVEESEESETEINDELPAEDETSVEAEETETSVESDESSDTESTTPAEDESAEETNEEEEEVISFNAIAADSLLSESQLSAIDFSSKRLLVAANPSAIVDPEHILSEYDGVYLLQYPDATTAKYAYSYYYGKAAFVDVDSVVSIASGDSGANGTAEMTENNNPLSELNEAVQENPGSIAGTVVALIDTGVNDMTNVIEAVSMIGDNAGDDNGHGTKMAAFIREQNPDVRIISIKALGKNGTGDASAIYAAMVYAMERGATIINLSVSATKKADNAAIQTLADEMAKKGIKVVGAAGNKGNNAAYYMPGCIQSAYIIGACDETGVRISISNFGSTVDFNVVAESTSEAAAKFSGILSKTGKVEADMVTVFPTDYEPDEGEEPDEDMEFTVSLGPNMEKAAPSSTMKLSDYLGINGDDIVKQLKVHESDTYYRTTPYQGSWDADDPYYNLAANGDVNTRNGKYAAGMNCTGFVSRVIVDVAGSDSALRAMCNWVANNTTYSGYGSFVNASNYNRFVMDYRTGNNVGIEHYWYANKANLLAGKAGGFKYGDTNVPSATYVPQKGDIIFCEINRDMYDDGSAWGWGSFDGHTDPEGNAIDVHIGYYWGENGSDVWWHSSHSGNGVASFVDYDNGSTSGNVISRVAPKSNSIFLVIPMGGHDTPDEGDVTLVKTSANTGISNGNSLYSLAGTEYGIYASEADARAHKSAVGTLTVKADGTTNTLTLDAGDYWYSETKVGNGYLFDSSYRIPVKFTVEPDKPYTIRVSDEPVTDPNRFRINKVDGTSSKLITSSSAVFKVEYYMNNNATGSPSATWYYKTIDGFTMLNVESYLDTSKSNSSFYRNSNGDITFPLGSIKVTEVTAPTGYVSLGDTFSLVGTITQPTSGGNATFRWTTAGSSTLKYESDGTPTIENTKIRGGVKFLKVNEATGKADERAEGTVITIYADEAIEDGNTTYAKDDAVMTVTIGKDGTASTASDALAYGKYYAKETSTTDQFVLNTEWKGTFSITENGTTVDLTDKPLENAPVRGGVKFLKVNEETGLADERAEGTVITIYAAEEIVDGSKTYAKDDAVMTVTVDKDGTAETADDALVYGKYYAKETAKTAPFLLKTTWNVSFSITENKVIVDKTDEKLENTPIRGGVKFAKIDAETEEAEPQGEAVLNGAEISIYADETIVDGTKTYSKDDLVMTLVTDAEGKTTTGKRDLPYGKYYAKETKASAGYLVNASWKKSFSIVEDSVIVDATDSTLNESIIRGDIRFMKVNIDGDPMPGIPFIIHRLDADGNIVESHVIVSDENGWVDTSARSKTDDKVNSLDDYVSAGTFTDDSKLDMEAGVWFGEQSARNDSRGALIYATYSIEELRCEANKGQDLLKTDAPIEIRKNNETVQLSNTLVDLNIRLTSEALDVESDSKVITLSSSVELSDTVSYIHLKTYSTYELETTFYNIRKDGKAVKLGSNTISFTPSKTDNTKTAYGDITNTVTVDTTKAQPGSTIVAVDVLYKVEDGVKTEVASHNEDYAEESQKLLVPEIRTMAADAYTEDHVGTVTVDAVIKDQLMYSNLCNQKVYMIVATLHEAETGDKVGESVSKLLRINYKDTEVTEKTLYLQGPKDGTVEMPEIRFDASQYEGKTLVITEVLIDMDTQEVVLRHESLDDEDQSVHFPQVRTTAKDSQTGDHVGTVGKTKIVDAVKVTNLVVGQPYTLKGKAVYQEDCTDANGTAHKAGDTLVDGLEKQFTATATEMTVELEYEVDASILEGTTVVVFEDLYHNDVKVASHADLDDEEQSVHYPKVRTSARDSETKTHTGVVGDEATIIDTVKLYNLIVDEEYTVSGAMMDSEGNPFMDLTAEKTFTATAKEMEIELSFTFDSSELGGKSLVVFEKLLHNDVEVARHEDKDDKDQTIDYPDLHTNASDIETADHVGTVEEKATIIDVVTYSNVREGETYTINGVLYYTESGDPVVDADGNEIVASTTFTAEKKNGTVKLIYTLDSTLLKGQTVVVFEDLYTNDVKVNSHADLEDEEQSVHYPDVKTTAADIITGDHVGTTNTDTVIVDKVKISNLIVGQPYKVAGTLMDAEANEAILDADGNNIESETEEFVATDTEMEIELTFTIDASVRLNTTTVVFENLIHNNIVVASHAEIDDEDQSVHHPEIKTHAKDEVTGDQVGQAREETTIIDVVNVHNLIVGMKYKITGTVMDKASGKAYIDADGKEVHAETDEFVAKASDMTIEMSYTFNGSNLRGRSIVVFEDLLHNDYAVAVHHDIEDTDQDVDFPDVRTLAQGEDTQTNLLLAEKEQTIVDTVYYSNARIGETYQVEGILMSPASGEPIYVGGKTVTAKSEPFVAKTKNGTVEVKFTFDATYLAGETIVVFEDLLHNDVRVAVHADLEDKDQTIYVPEIKTTLMDTKTEDHIANASEEIVLVDTVEYKNLVADGREYVMTGVLYDEETGEKVLDDNGKEVTASASFVPEESDGTVEITFTFSGVSLAGKTVVAFEECTYNGKSVAVHADLEDEAQTVVIPKVGTKVRDEKDGDQLVKPDEVITLIDTVEVDNLIPGQKYIIRGEMMNKKTGKVFTEDTTTEKNVPVIVDSGVFVADNSHMSIDVKFIFNTIGVEDIDLVVFETLYLVKEDEDGNVTEIEVGKHQDLEDKNQTVHVEKRPTPNVKTGDTTPVLPLVGLLGCSGIGFAFIEKRRRMLHQNED